MIDHLYLFLSLICLPIPHSANFNFSLYPAVSKNIEEDRNWGIRKDRTFLSLPTHHFASLKSYLFLFAHLSRVTGNIYLFLSLCLVISIFSYPLVYPSTKEVSIFFSIFRDRSLVSFSILHYLPIVKIVISLYTPQYTPCIQKKNTTKFGPKNITQNKQSHDCLFWVMFFGPNFVVFFFVF